METSNLIDAILDLISQPNSLTEEDAELMAYRECALCDILNRLTDRPHDDPDDVLYWYMVEMENCKNMLAGHAINQFDVAADTANYILALMEYPREN